MTEPRHDWDDDRLDHAYRARFDVAPPPELTERITSEMSNRTQPGWRGWAWTRPRSAVLVAGASLLFAVALLASGGGWLGPVPRLGPSFGVPLPSGIAVSDLAGDPFPVQVTSPSATRTLPVLSVAGAIASRGRTIGPFEIAVGGWFLRSIPSCPAPPTQTSDLESCGQNSTWLLSGPDSLPGIHPVTNWSPSDSSVPTALVFVGHFHDPRAASCPAGDRRLACDALFVVDGIAWESPTNLEAFPVQAAGYAVISVSAAGSIRDSGASTEIAVAGWYEPLPVIFCALWLGPAIFPLEGDCSVGRQWLTETPEQLVQTNPCPEGGGSAQCTSDRPPTGPAISAVFERGVGDALSRRAQSTPTAVVFIGHFNDPRSAGCRSPAACTQRFVVDAIAWADGSFFALPSPR